MQLENAYPLAASLLKDLSQFCDKIEIAGSIRRRKQTVKDIEIVCIPKKISVPDGLFDSKYVRSPGFVKYLKRKTIIKGDPEKGKYIKIFYNKDIKADIFCAHKENWGYIFAIRTGSAEFSHHILGKAWVKNGFRSTQGMLNKNGVAVPILTEERFFELLKIDSKYLNPKIREL